MSERRKSTPSRLEFLRMSNIPERLLYQVNNDGIQQDYGNQWVGPLFMLNALGFNPHSSILAAADADAETTIKQAIGGTQTYSAYWRERLEDYNHFTPEPNKIDTGAAFDLLVTQQPGSRTLDSLAERALALTDSEADPKSLVLSYVRLAAQAVLITSGRKESRTLLEKFGLIERI